MAEILKGSAAAKKYYEDFAIRSAELKKSGVTPAVRIFLASDDPGSEIYSSMIMKNCAKAGIESIISRIDKGLDTAEVLKHIRGANSDKSVHGIIVMLPLWKGIDEKAVLSEIAPEKDIDGVNPVNAGKLVLGDECFHPSTAEACVEILRAYGYDPSGKHVVIIGRSNIVGKPLANILVQKGVDATVTVCHSRTKGIKDICRTADILIAAAGSPELVTEEFTNAGQVVIDVGMNEVPDGIGGTKLCGDVAYDRVRDMVKAITPVPGGISPFTHVSLIKNIFKSIEIQLLRTN